MVGHASIAPPAARHRRFWALLAGLTEADFCVFYAAAQRALRCTCTRRALRAVHRPQSNTKSWPVKCLLASVHRKHIFVRPASKRFGLDRPSFGRLGEMSEMDDRTRLLLHDNRGRWRICDFPERLCAQYKCQTWRPTFTEFRIRSWNGHDSRYGVSNAVIASAPTCLG